MIKVKNPNYIPPRLPDTYQEVEYIQAATYSSNMLLGLEITDNNYDIDVLFEITNLTRGTNYVLGGGLTTIERQNNINAFILYYDSSQFKFEDHSKINTGIVPQANKPIRFRTDRSNVIFNVDSNEYVYPRDTTPFTISSSRIYNFLLFGATLESDSYINRNLRLYNCKIYYNSNLVRDLVPCIRKADDIVGMYDLVNNNFYISGQNNYVPGDNAESSEYFNLLPKPLNRNLIRRYIGNNLVYSPYKYTTFARSIAPTSWTAVTNYTRYTANNTYGTWTIFTTNAYNRLYSASYAFNESTGDVWRSSSSTSDTARNECTIELPTNVLIKPTSINIIHSYCGNTANPAYLQGFNPTTNEWETLGTLISSTSTQTQTFNLNGNIFYSKFRCYLTRYKVGSTYQYIYDFKINSGTVKVSGGA